MTSEQVAIAREVVVLVYTKNGKQWEQNRFKLKKLKAKTMSSSTGHHFKMRRKHWSGLKATRWSLELTGLFPRLFQIVRGKNNFFCIFAHAFSE